MNGYKLLPMLVSVLLLAGCQGSQLTLTKETSAAVANSAGGRPAVCSQWRPIFYSSKDTDGTKDQARGNNAAREGYGCPPPKR